MTATISTGEMLEWLAAHLVSCGSTSHSLVEGVEPLPKGKVLHGPFEVDCELCGGTGEVPKYPMLSEPCPGDFDPQGEFDESRTFSAVPTGTHGKEMYVQCNCGGSGRIPVRTLEAVWAAARSIGWHPKFYYAQGSPPEDSVNRGFFHQERGAVMSQEREDFAGFVEALYECVDINRRYGDVM
jgi:hypothetical protein